MTKRTLIQKLNIARCIHAGWAKEQAARRRQGRPKARLVGGETWHREWCRVYDEAVKRLEK